jgi:hypothetical protein
VEHVAIVTVKFRRAVKGEEIAEAVRNILNNNGDPSIELVMERRFHNGISPLLTIWMVNRPLVLILWGAFRFIILYVYNLTQIVYSV